MTESYAHPGRWNDAFLNETSQHGDTIAEMALTSMLRDGEIGRIEEAFAKLNTNDHIPSQEIFPSLSAFCSATHHLPDHVDLSRIARAEQLFIANAFPIVLILLSKSLPEGYSAPNLSIVLNLSGNLRKHPYHRLLSVLQMVLNVASIGGFEHGGSAIVTAQKVRLLHAGIRHIVNERMPDYRERFGVPVNLEDMLATVMGFSYLVIIGMRTMHCRLRPEEEEDVLYLWRVFALLCGIHPPGEATSMAWIPDSVDDAGRFYTAYARRHYVAASENPDGVALTQSNLSMLRDMLPTWLRVLGFGIAPRMYMQHLVGIEGCRRVGVAPLPGHRVLKTFLELIPYVLYRISRFNSISEQGPRVHRHHVISRVLFQHLIDNAFGHAVTFTVPVSIKDFHKMV